MELKDKVVVITGAGRGIGATAAELCAKNGAKVVVADVNEEWGKKVTDGIVKQGLAAMRHVTLHTPMSQDLSAGIVCFDVNGMAPRQVVEKLRERGIVGSVTPYATKYVRLAPSLINSPKEIETTLEEIRKLSTG